MRGDSEEQEGKQEMNEDLIELLGKKKRVSFLFLFLADARLQKKALQGPHHLYNYRGCSVISYAKWKEAQKSCNNVSDYLIMEEIRCN